jgi:hypothetical protein
LFMFATNIKREVCGVLEFFFFYNLIKWKKSHNMLCLMLDVRFKSFHIVFFLLVMKKVWALLKNMIADYYILCFWNVIIIYIQWQNLKLAM